MPLLRRLALLATLGALLLPSAAGASSARPTPPGATAAPVHLDQRRTGLNLPVSPLRARRAAIAGVTAARAKHKHRSRRHHHSHKRHRKHKKHKKKHKRKPAPKPVNRPLPDPITANAADGGPDWCGRPLQGDDTTDQVFPTEPTLKLIYAYPKGQPDRFSYWAPILQANVGVMMQFVASQSGGLKTLRFDMGTSCGPQYVDIQRLPLSGPVDRYLDDYGDPVVDPGTPLHNEVDAATRGEHNHNYVVFADDLNHVTSGPLWAWGMTDVLIHDARPGPENQNNLPGRISAVFGPDGGLPPQGPLGFDSTMFLHEIMHSLGAVQPGAPHATAGGHCWDGGDVMCYDDGTAGASKFSYSYCSQVGGEIYQPLDCNKDDYFSPAPPPGSYLASHWNSFDSVFLAPCTDARVTAACNP